MTVRVLLLADTHLGFDLPTRPRVPRRRRGHDFMANYRRALAPAFAGEVDLVIHAGDVFDRPRVPHTLVYEAFEPLRRIADSGLPVFVVPGNHERSRIPAARFARHPRIHVFDEPRSFLLERGGVRIAVGGFPYRRKDVRTLFGDLVEATGLTDVAADVSLLCVHHCFEGATVGPADYTFRSAPDVVRAADVPERVAAVLTGHVHRHQVLTTDLGGRPLAAPVLYPGSVERTAFAEAGETKGYLLLEVDGSDPPGGRLRSWRFEELPARPMVVRDLKVEGLGRSDLLRLVSTEVARAPADAILRLRLRGGLRPEARAALAARRLRAITPARMNLEVIGLDDRGAPRRRSDRRRPRSGADTEAGQLVLGV